MRELVEELYKELDSIFKEYTINYWKNDWCNEGDRKTKSRSLLKPTKNHNMFLLCKTGEWRDGISFELRTVEGFHLEVKWENGNDKIRFDIEANLTDLDIYYYITEKMWEANKSFIIDLCKSEYKSTIMKRKQLEEIGKLYGEIDPVISLKAYREQQLKEILEDE